MEEESKDKGFVIKDRRIFDEKGDVRQEAGPEEQQANKVEREDTDLLEPTFSNFILSLSTSAMYHFGDLPDPVTNERKVNLQAARHTIDLLAMLKTKTEGNLDENEKSLLDGLLFELRMRYVKEAGGRR